VLSATVIGRNWRVANTSLEELVRMMVGRNIEAHASRGSRQTNRVVLKVEHLSRTKKSAQPHSGYACAI